MRIFLEREKEREKERGRSRGEGEEREGGRKEGRKEREEGEGGRRGEEMEGGEEGRVSINKGGSTLHTYLQVWIIVVTTSCISLALVSKDLLYQTTGIFLAVYMHVSKLVSQKRNHFPW